MDIEELEQEAEAIKSGAGTDIKSADEVVQDADAGAKFTEEESDAGTETETE
jgi:hypothetical protein